MKLDPAADTRTPEQIEIDRLRSELDHFTKSGIIEIAVRNPSVSEYMKHWEGRALKAEAALSCLAGEGWRPIETAPKDGRLILVATDALQKVGTPAWTGMYCAYWNDADDLWHFHTEGYVRDPRYWRDLPAAPSVEENLP